MSANAFSQQHNIEYLHQFPNTLNVNSITSSHLPAD